MNRKLKYRKGKDETSSFFPELRVMSGKTLKWVKSQHHHPYLTGLGPPQHRQNSRVLHHMSERLGSRRIDSLILVTLLYLLVQRFFLCKMMG